MVLGSNRDEGTMFVPFNKSTDKADYATWLDTEFAANASDVAKQYPLCVPRKACPRPLCRCVHT